jgi:hypothetical protein
VCQITPDFSQHVQNGQTNQSRKFQDNWDKNILEGSNAWKLGMHSSVGSLRTGEVRSGSNSKPFEVNCKFILAAGEHASNNALASTLSTEPDKSPKVLAETWGTGCY